MKSPDITIDRVPAPAWALLLKLLQGRILGRILGHILGHILGLVRVAGSVRVRESAGVSRATP